MSTAAEPRIVDLLEQERKFVDVIYSKFENDHAYLWEEFEDTLKLRRILTVMIRIFYQEHRILNDLSPQEQLELSRAVRELISDPHSLLQKANESYILELEHLGIEWWFERFKKDIETINSIISNREQLEQQRIANQQRFEEKAQKYAERTFIKKIVTTDSAPKDFAHAEALSDDADFNRRNTEEFREWQKQLQVVIANLKKKRDDPNGAGKNIRPLLLILGGGMQGPYGAGQGIALIEMGFGQRFDVVVGISAGACDAAYFLAGREQLALGTAIYYNECITPEFLNFKRFRRIMDVGYLTTKVMNQGGTKPLDVDAIKRNHSEFWVQVTNARTSEPVLLNAKIIREGILEAVHASMALPVVYRKTVNIEGTDYIDGAFEPLPIEEVVRRFNPTDVLILPNSPFTDTDSIQVSPGQYALAKVMRGTSLALVRKVLTHKQQMRQSLDYMKKSKGVNVGMMWPPDCGLTQVTQDAGQIKMAAFESGMDTFKNFGESGKINLL